MAGYRYELIVGEREDRVAYWSAYRLRPGSRVVVSHRALVIEDEEAAGGDVDFVAHCRVDSPRFPKPERQDKAGQHAPAAAGAVPQP
jgi:hypothetical protein